MRSRLLFSPNPNFTGRVIPPEQGELQRAFDVTVNVVRAATSNDATFRADFERLLKYAQVIFGDSPAMLGYGTKWLADFRQEVLDREGPAIKDKYLSDLARVAMISSGSLLFIGLAVQLITAAYLRDLAPATTTTIALSDKVSFDLYTAPFHVGAALAASMWGIWLSRFWSCSTLEFTQLNIVEADMLKPWSRFLGYGLTAFFTMLILLSGVVSFNLGSFSALHIGDNIVVALVVGLALGFLDKALPDFIRRPLAAAMAGQQKKPSSQHTGATHTRGHHDGA
ncbi:hypothetical protein FSO04_18565 [Paraburkholderia madseniana]|uniref:Uncharacterized protein n=1 Tax=Paraburkholderia madseniana TaxID=2599607 RepID=A0A6N6WG29_9BURK|nr:hypothetical protein [Paraburkholderia madseniana]KAE8758400.1 hypothetical protein FSO04_18565 [Paraburkholderia madseniana]